MKFRYKIFLISFMFVTISINLIGIIIINNTYKTQINSKIENNIDKIKDIGNIVSFYNMSDINSNLFNKDDTYYEISNNENIIFTNLTFDKSGIEEKITPVENEIKAMISNEKIFVSTKINNYNIIIAEDIKEIYINRDEQIQFFIKVSMIFSFTIAFSLYVVIFLLTRRINKLDKALKQIQDGNYSTRVKNLGEDEIGNLATSFNQMATSICDNINEIQRVSENRKNFINDITHEIRTPITSIIGYSSLIKSGKVRDSKTIIEYNNMIYEEGNYLNLISQKLMDIVLLDNKTIELELVNISDILNKIIESKSKSSFDILFKSNIEKNINIQSDKVLLQSLIVNIINNSITACKDKEDKIIIIKLEKIDEKQVILEIRDNGIGMSEEQLKKVKEPFYTLNKSRNRKVSGMGLGLPLCVKICDVLNAEMNIKSKIGEETSVEINFKI